jgi:hypothetical protein
MLAVHDRVIAEEFTGAPHTVAKIIEGVEAGTPAQRYKIRLLAEEIVGGLQPKDFLSEILAVYWFCVGHTRYTNDPKPIELVKAAWVIVEEIAAGKRPLIDCDEMVELMLALLLMLGRQVQIVTVAFDNKFYNGERQYSHVIIRVREPRSGRWIVLDPVAAEDTDKMLHRVVAAKIWPVA